MVQNSYSTANAFLIQIPEAGHLGPPPTVTQLSPMHFTRGFCNSVVLPDGQVAVLGGQVSGVSPDPVL